SPAGWKNTCCDGADAFDRGTDVLRLEPHQRAARYRATRSNATRVAIMLTTILIVILILALLGALPTWGYSRGWGYGPGGGIGLILIIVLILALTGHVLHRARVALSARVDRANSE